MENPTLFFGCSVLTCIGSAAAAAMECLVLLGVGWESIGFDSLLAVTIFSTIGLITGTVGLLTDRAWPTMMLILSSAYIPVALVLLTLRGFAPPGAWWLLLPLSLIEIALGWRTMTGARKTTSVGE